MTNAVIPSLPSHPSVNALTLRRRARGLNLDKLSDSDAVDAFVGVVNALLFHDVRDRDRMSTTSQRERVQIRWASPDEKAATADAKTGVITLPWPGPTVDAEQYLALRGYSLQEFGRMKCTHPQLAERVKANGGDDAAQLAGIFESRRVDQILTAAFGATYTEAKAQIARDCTPTTEQYAEFMNADPATRLINDFTILARGLPYDTASASAVVDRLKKWMQLAGQQSSKKGLSADSWGYRIDKQLATDATNQQEMSAAAQQSANLTQVFITAFKDILDQRPPKDPKDQQEQPDPNSDGQGTGDGQGNGTGNGSGQGSGQSGPSMANQLNQGLQSGADKTQFHQMHQNPTDAQEEVAGTDGAQTGASTDFGRYAPSPTNPDLTDVLRRRGARVAATLRRSLAAKSRYGDETDMDDGDLDPDKLCDIARGKWDAPFMRPGRIIHDRDTAVHICLDGSSSMDDPPNENGEFSAFIDRCGPGGNQFTALDGLCSQMQPDAAGAIRDMADATRRKSPALAAQMATPFSWANYLLSSKVWVSGATLAIHDALRSSRIAHEISVFAGPYVVIKNWKQRGFQANIQQIFREGGFAAGGTPAGSSWKNSLGSLLKRRETRRILIVMSDGEIPSNEATLGRAVIQTARELGVECYGLGIMSRGVEKVFPRGSKSVATVQFGDDLNRRMQDLVHGILTKAGHAR